MATLTIKNLEAQPVTQAEAEQVMGGYELKNVLVSSYSRGGFHAGFSGGVHVASGDIN